MCSVGARGCQDKGALTPVVRGAQKTVARLADLEIADAGEVNQPPPIQDRQFSPAVPDETRRLETPGGLGDADTPHAQVAGQGVVRDREFTRARELVEVEDPRGQ